MTTQSAFYQKYGFIPLQDDPFHLYLPMATVRAMFPQAGHGEYLRNRCVRFFSRGVAAGSRPGGVDSLQFHGIHSGHGSAGGG